MNTNLKPPTCLLALRPTAKPVRDAVAWYIPSGDPEDWLREMLVSGASLTDTKLFPLPSSPRNLVAAGVLVVPASTAKASFSRRCQPYGRIGSRMYLPVNAALCPPLSDAEVEQSVGFDSVSVMHPGLGLVVIESGQELRPADLLSVASQRPSDWSGAHPGLALPRKLLGVEPELTQSVEIMLMEGRDDIGTQAKHWDDLPPTPSEPRDSPLSGISRAAGRQLAKFVQWVTSGVPKTASAPTYFDRLEQWAINKLQLESERAREVRRLMNLLRENPDEGLKYALPMGGQSQHRGVAPPSNRLNQRDVNFQLGHLGNSGPADFWDIPPDTQQRLVQQYRELANRELRLGRHRRAAYIFAELLNDVNSAASALSSGGHWREAAILYKERLNRPWDAAICYQKGALWSEAIKLYEELRAFEHAGDLHATLGQTEEATAAFETAVANCRQGGDFIGASRIRETKLEDMEGALAELADGWHASAQATLCLKRSFQIMGQLGRHAEADDLLVQLQSQILPRNLQCPLVETLGGTAASYPDESLKLKMADAVRVLTAKLLPDAMSADRDRILKTVANLVPNDRLLGRDCQRYRPPALEPVKKVSAKRRLITDRVPVLTGVIKLPPFINWRVAESGGSYFYAAGYKGQELVVLRGSWDGSFQFPIHERWEMPSCPSKIVMSAPLVDGQTLFVQPQDSPSIRPRHFPKTQDFSGVLMIRGLSARVQAASRSSAGTIWTAERTTVDDVQIVKYKDIGQLVVMGVFSLHDLKFNHEHVKVCLAATSEMGYVGFEDQLIQMLPAGKSKVHTMPDVIQQLSLVSPIGAPIPLLAGFSRGGGLIWNPESCDRFSEDMEDAVFGSIAQGWIIGDDGHTCRVHRVVNRRVSVQGETEGGGDPPLSILPMLEPDRFAVARRNGEISLYRIDP